MKYTLTQTERLLFNELFRKEAARGGSIPCELFGEFGLNDIHDTAGKINELLSRTESRTGKDTIAIACECMDIFEDDIKKACVKRFDDIIRECSSDFGFDWSNYDVMFHEIHPAFPILMKCVVPMIMSIHKTGHAGGAFFKQLIDKFCAELYEEMSIEEADEFVEYMWGFIVELPPF